MGFVHFVHCYLLLTFATTLVLAVVFITGLRYSRSVGHAVSTAVLGGFVLFTVSLAG